MKCDSYKYKTIKRKKKILFLDWYLCVVFTASFDFKS